MENRKFITEVYQILEKGRIELNGQMYYSEDAVMDAMEWMKEHMGSILEVETGNILANFAKTLSEAITGKK
jgi:hypothetical protein